MRESVAHIFSARVEAHPDRDLFRFLSADGSVRERYTYGSFRHRVGQIAAGLVDLGIPPGRTALLVYPPGIEMAAAVFACAFAGVIPVPAPPPQSNHQRALARLVDISRHAEAEYVLSTSELTRRVSTGKKKPDEILDAPLTALHWVATDQMLGSSSAELPRKASDIFLVQYTSGSTSAPRGVAVTHANVIHNAGLCVDHEQPIGVSWLPHFHDMGLLGYFLFSVVKGGEAHCFSPADFLRRPVFWLQLISQIRATITTAPNAAFEYCLRNDKVSDDHLNGVDLSSLRSMVNAAEPVRAATFERFWRRFSSYGLRKTAQVAGYGLAEHTLCVTTGGRRRIKWNPGRCSGEIAAVGGDQFVSCGKPQASVAIRIVDPNTLAPTPEGGAGEIWVDSPSKAAGYWGMPALTRQQFKAQVLGGDPDRREYLRTGDIGFLHKGELYVCGRLSDMVVVSGRNVFPSDVEAVIEQQFPMLVGRVVAFGASDLGGATEQLVVAVEAGAGLPSLDRIRIAVHDACGVPIGTIATVPRGWVLRTSSGKLARHRCRSKWDSGQTPTFEVITTLKNPSRLTLDEIIERLESRAQALGTPNATLDQLGLDSVSLVDLSLAIEEALDQQGMLSPSLTEHVSDLSLLQGLRVSDVRTGLAALQAGGVESEEILRLFSHSAEIMREEERSQMRSDAQLSLPRRSPMSRVTPDRTRVLLTGATGFLGSHLLKCLLELTPDPVTVLLRCESLAHGLSRVRRALLQAGAAPEAVAHALRSRVTVLAGDLALPRFGMSSEEWETLGQSVAHIYHAGAEVDYVKSYNLLRAVNVGSTREVIALAAQGYQTRLHYISTTFVFGWSTQAFLFETDNNATMSDLDFGYAQSKWVAEHLVHSAGAQGVATSIYRPSLVTASAAGHFVRRDITARVLGYMIRHGVTVDAANQISFLPVDVCAQNIVAISRNREPARPVLHMTSDAHHTIAEICEVISKKFGYAFEEMSLADFLRHAHVHCGVDDDLYPLLSFLDRNTARISRMGAKRYESSIYRELRDSTPLAVPHPSLVNTINPIVGFLQEEGLIPPAAERGARRGGYRQ